MPETFPVGGLHLVRPHPDVLMLLSVSCFMVLNSLLLLIKI